MKGGRVGERVDLAVGLGPPHAVLPDVNAGRAEEVEPRCAHHLDEARVRAQVRIVEVGMVHGQGAEHERGEGEGGQGPHVGRRRPPACEEPAADDHAGQAEEGEGEHDAAEEAVDQPGIAQQTEGRGYGPRRREQRRAAQVPAGEHVQRDEERDDEGGHEPGAALQVHAAGAGQTYPVELEAQVLPLVRVGVDRQRHGRRVPSSERGRALLETAAAAFEAVDDAAGEDDLHDRRLPEHAREAIRERHRPARHRQRQVDGRVVGGPVGGHPVVDLVGRREARQVGRVAGPEVQRDREGPARARDRRQQRHGDDGQRERGVARDAPLNQ